MSFIERLSSAVEMSESDILRIISSAPRRYKIYGIPKRDGIGTRVIAQPAREVKMIQRYTMDAVLSRLPVHRSAMAYVSGKNIADNARAHVRGRVIMKLDFKDFFHSLVYKDLAGVLRRIGFTEIDQREWRTLENILFWHNPITGVKCLSIGAPSSPMVSNIVMERIDASVVKLCQANKVVYTRYADDITLSASTVEALLGAEREIRSVIKKSRSPKLIFNEAKRGIFTQAVRRLVTGLVITPEGKVSLGRARKREISAALHHIVTGKNRSIEHIANTKGWVAYAKSVEPLFFEAMLLKYGAVMLNVLQTPTPPRNLR